MENITTTNVGGFMPTLTHVPAPSVVDGVVNADPRLRRIWGEVCPLVPSAQVQGSALPIVTQLAGTRVMGAQFDKYRTGSHAIGLSG